MNMNKNNVELFFFIESLNLIEIKLRRPLLIFTIAQILKYNEETNVNF
jgi:hypothetical protein